MSSPSAFLHPASPRCPDDLLTRAQAGTPPRVAIARAGATLPMQAAKEATQAGIMDPIFVGEPDRITAEAAALNWDISAYRLVRAEGEEASGLAAAALCGAGEADVLLKGDLHTDTYMKAVLSRDSGLRTGNRLVHVFYISPPDGSRPLLVCDGAVNVTPDLKTRQAGIGAVIQVLQATGVERPKVAILSATESEIPSVPSSLEAAELRDWARENHPEADVSGPLALDLILSPDAVATKGLSDDPVAGQADAVIVPDLVAGNTLFKALVYMGGGCAAGVVLGAKVPVLLTSRADPAAARMASCALAAVLANAT